MIESWFFHDLEGICKYLGINYSKSLQRTHKNTEMLDRKDLTKLFNKGSKKRYYKKGEEGFLNSLDIDKIYEKCADLKKGIQDINNDLDKYTK